LFGSFGVIRDVDLDLTPAAAEWLVTEGTPESYGSKEAQFLTDRKTNMDDQVTGMMVLALDGMKTIGAAWDTYLKLKGQGVSWDDLGAQVKMVRKDTNDAIGLLQSVLSRLFFYE